MKLKYACVLVLVLSALSFSVNGYLYSQESFLASDELFQERLGTMEIQVANLTKEVADLKMDNAVIEDYLAGLENATATLPNNITALQKENAELRNETETLQARVDQEINAISDGTPKIVTRLGATDVRSTPAPGHSWSGIIRFYISGEVWNVGTAPARNCTLHVTLYQGSTIANETYIPLGTIVAGFYADVSADIYYVGPALTNWTINPEFSANT